MFNDSVPSYEQSGKASLGVAVMCVRRVIDFQSLSVQLILSYIFLVLCTSVLIGLPAFLLIDEQLDANGWLQVEHGLWASRALYASRQSEIADLAMIIAQRPTLRDALAQGEFQTIPPYLETLRSSAGVDGIIICEGDQALLTPSEQSDSGFCALPQAQGFQVLSTPMGAEGFLLAESVIPDGQLDAFRIIVVRTLDPSFTEALHEQTGLEQILLAGNQVLAASLPHAEHVIKAAFEARTPAAPEEGAAAFTLALDGSPYYAASLPLEPDHVMAVVGLSAESIVAARRNLIGSMIAAVAIVATLASILGLQFARRIGSGFTGLQRAAQKFQSGDMDSPIDVQSQVREAQVTSQALESARQDLRRSFHELEQHKAWMDQLHEAIVEGIVTLDPQGRIAYFSAGAERITGWSRDEVMHRPCDDFFQLLNSDQPFTEAIPAPGQRRRVHVELADGRHASLAVSGAKLPPREAGHAEVVFVVRDVSEEEAVHHLLGHFIANIAHEFRTPLSALAASIELLLDSQETLTQEENSELLQSIRLGVVGLQTLIDNLLESASIETGHFYVAPRATDLTKIITDAIALLQPLLDKHDQSISVLLPARLPIVHADPKRTLQVMLNLLSNANRYAPDGSEILIAAAESQGWVRTTVKDAGPGIQPEDRERIFRRFVHSRGQDVRAHYGAGLGLSVVKAIIEAHGGQVGVEGASPGGSLFWFTLPTARDS